MCREAPLNLHNSHVCGLLFPSDTILVDYLPDKVIVWFDHHRAYVARKCALTKMEDNEWYDTAIMKALLTMVLILPVKCII